MMLAKLESHGGYGLQPVVDRASLCKPDLKGIENGTQQSPYSPRLNKLTTNFESQSDA